MSAHASPRGARVRAVLLAFATLFAAAGCALVGTGTQAPPLDVEFAGNTSFAVRELLDVTSRTLRGYARSQWKRSVIDDAASELEDFYRDQGFPRARATYELSERPEGRDRAVFRVDEGPRAVLAALEFEGNASRPASELAPLFEWPGPAGLGGALTGALGRVLGDGTRWYSERSARRGAREIERSYADRGWTDCVVDAPEVVFDASGTRAEVTVHVREGIRYRLASVAVEIDGASGLDAELVRGAWAGDVGKPFDERTRVEIGGRIEQLFADRGYPDVRAELASRAATTEGAVSLVFRVTPGPLVHVGDVTLRGNDSTQDRFVKSRIALRRGGLYTRAHERETLADLYRTGLFETAELHWTPAADGVRDLEVELKEAPSLETWLEPGYGSYERARVSAGLRERNLFGTGRAFLVDGTAGALAWNGRGSLVDPWTFGRDTTAELSVFGGQREEPSFQRTELGSRIQLTRSLGEHWEGSAAYQYKFSGIDEVDVDALLDPALTDDVDISSVTAALAHDTRDLVFDPTRGESSRASVEVATAVLGSELDFVRVRASHTSLVRLHEDETLLAIAFRTGWIVPTGGTQEIPLQERFFNGGESTVRSFREDHLGPRDADGTPIGGEAYNVLSAEIRQRLGGRWRAALFVDAGNVVTDHSDYFELRGVRYGVGVGLRYSLPIGPLRLDAALNPDPEAGESDGAIHLSLGLAF